jgi:glucose-6-phosphate 1-dehydrogenase
VGEVALRTAHLPDALVRLQPQDLSAYARLLLDVFEGNAVLSIRGDEAEESWRIVEPILAGWSTNAAPLLDYPAGAGLTRNDRDRAGADEGA